jgi:hypothetical protein
VKCAEMAQGWSNSRAYGKKASGFITGNVLNNYQL